MPQVVLLCSLHCGSWVVFTELISTLLCAVLGEEWGQPQAGLQLKVHSLGHPQIEEVTTTERDGL